MVLAIAMGAGYCLGGLVVFKAIGRELNKHGFKLGIGFKWGKTND